jgi:hypothetical protein
MNRPQLDKLPLVLVEWHDAWTNELGVTVEDVGASHKAMTVHTLGWLLKDNEAGVSLANEYFDDQYRGRTFIPRAMVVNVTQMRLSKKTERKPKEKTINAEP